jgi:hypothetical protein
MLPGFMMRGETHGCPPLCFPLLDTSFCDRCHLVLTVTLTATLVGVLPKGIHSHTVSDPTVDLPFLATLIDDLLTGSMTIH